MVTYEKESAGWPFHQNNSSLHLDSNMQLFLGSEGGIAQSVTLVTSPPGGTKITGSNPTGAIIFSP